MEIEPLLKRKKNNAKNAAVSVGYDLSLSFKEARVTKKNVKKPYSDTIFGTLRLNHRISEVAP